MEAKVRYSSKPIRKAADISLYDGLVSQRNESDELIESIAAINLKRHESMARHEQQDSGFLEEPKYDSYSEEATSSQAYELQNIKSKKDEDQLQRNTNLNEIGNAIKELPTRNNRHKHAALMLHVDPATARKCELSDYYFLEHYYGLLSYLQNRAQRTQSFKDAAAEGSFSSEKYDLEWKKHCARETGFLRKRRAKTNFKEFQVLAQIGQGGYGQVFLCRKQDTNEICALKKMSKSVLAKMNEVGHILTERDVLVQTKTEWLVQLLYAFHDQDDVYLAMEYVPGGDLRTLLNNSGILRENDARFYCAEMFIAINELHKLGYIHRDLKPENFLVDKTGHLKLTDFGLSKGRLSSVRMESLRIKLEAVKNISPTKCSSSLERRRFYKTFQQENTSRAFTLVGSPDYMAPEVLTSSNHSSRTGIFASGYDYLVDYWALGCILFEFLAGYPPFAASSSDEVWSNLYHWQEVLERPHYSGVDEEFNLSDDSWELIGKLITHRHKRLSSIVQVQSHPWFQPINAGILDLFHSKTSTCVENPFPPLNNSYLWAHLRYVPTAKKIARINSGERLFFEPPFVPNLNSDADHGHFDDFTNPIGENMHIYKEIYEKQKMLDNQPHNEEKKTAEKRKYIGFTYRHGSAISWETIDHEIKQHAASAVKKSTFGFH